MRTSLRKTVLIAVAAASAFGTSAMAQPSTKPAPQCFYSQDWDGAWKAAPDSKSIYIHVGVNKTYRIGFAHACSQLQSPTTRLITHVPGGSTICSSADLDLSVSDGDSPAAGCIVSDVTPLSPAEAASLPKNLKP